MENHSNRSLAYILANTIKSDELEHISGGAIDSGISMRQSVTATGNSAQGGDLHYDTTCDF